MLRNDNLPEPLSRDTNINICSCALFPFLAVAVAVPRALFPKAWRPLSRGSPQDAAEYVPVSSYSLKSEGILRGIKKSSTAKSSATGLSSGIH